MLTSEEADFFIHPNLKKLSNSSCDLLHDCGREYQLYKLMKQIGWREESEHLDFGSLLGIGAQEYMVTKSLQAASFKAFCKWPTLLTDDRAERNKKTFWHCLLGLDKFPELYGRKFHGCELAYFDNKPAIELGFTIDFGSGWIYRGFLDGLLLDRRNGELIVFECKTTTKGANEAQYKRSGQALGYSLVVDVIAKKLALELKSSYRVSYVVYESAVGEWKEFDFHKSHTQRALWIKNVLMDIQYISWCAEGNYFPQNGKSCWKYGRQCKYYDVCDISDQRLIGDLDKVGLIVDKPELYQFHFTLQDIIESQLSKEQDS